jgi:hypothetical protein
MDHLLPFQRSTSVDLLFGPPENPTAVQARFDVHDTASRTLPCDPGGLGLRWIAHLLPFQRSTSVAVPYSPPATAESPTAVQARLDVHDTPLRVTPRGEPRGVGTD